MNGKIAESELQNLVNDILEFIDYKLNILENKEIEATKSFNPFQLIVALTTSILVNMTACALKESAVIEDKEKVVEDILKSICKSSLKSWALYCSQHDAKEVN